LPEQELDAIKWVLVEEALKVPTRVVPKAWIDQNGQLQEGTQVPNGMKVRGVRISNFLGNGTGEVVDRIATDETVADLTQVNILVKNTLSRLASVVPNGMKVQGVPISNFLGNGTGEVVDRIATDETVADLTQVNILVKNTLSRLASVVPNGMKVQGVPISNFLGNGTGEVVDRIATDETVADLTQVNIYFVPQDQRWMQSVSFTSDLSDSIRGDNRYFASKMLSEWLTQWDDAARTRSVGWSQSAHAPSSQGVYQAALQGEKKAEMAEWELSMRVHKFTPNLPLQVPALTTTLGATSVPAKTTYWQADWVLTKRGQQQAIWQYSQQLVWDVDALSLLPPDVPQTVINSMRLGSASGVQGINTLMSREPMQFSLFRQEGQYWTISGGSQNGLRVGDTLVLVNSRELLEPVLQASVTQGLALGEVVQVGAVRSTIRQVAGSKLPMSSAGSWMAIPY
jgi:lipoprotein signal peptidase